VWVTEHLLQATPGVEEATVSYASGIGHGCLERKGSLTGTC
jgi:hypothetical protein